MSNKENIFTSSDGCYQVNFPSFDPFLTQNPIRLPMQYMTILISDYLPKMTLQHFLGSAPYILGVDHDDIKTRMRKFINKGFFKRKWNVLLPISQSNYYFNFGESNIHIKELISQDYKFLKEEKDEKAILF